MMNHLAPLFVLSLVACGIRELPPPNAPEKKIPEGVEFPTEPPPSGHSRVLLDANGEKAKVVEVTGVVTGSVRGYSSSVVATRSLCTTPCVVDMQYGSHPLFFQAVSEPNRQSHVEVEVTAKPKVVRHALGETRPAGALQTVGATLLSLGLVSALTGGMLWGLGASLERPTSLEGVGQTMTIGGLGGILVSIPLLIVDRPEVRRGSTTEWTSDPGKPAPRDVGNVGM